MQLPPIAPALPPPPPPEPLGEDWRADRLRQTRHFLDWLADGSLGDGLAFLSRMHGADTHAKAVELLEKAVRSCAGETHNEATGSPALWAILLAQQAHALQNSVGDAPPAWEVTERPERWEVRAMHALLRDRQKQHVTLGGGSRAPSDTRTVGRGLGGAQQVRDLHPPSPLAPHPRTSSPFPPRPCAQLAGRSGEDAPMRPLRVDELGDDDAIKAKVGEHLTLTLTLTRTRTRTPTRPSF